MTILDKEEPRKNGKVKKKKNKKQPIFFYKLVSFILIILTIVTFGVLIYNETFTIFYMIPIIGGSAILLFIITFILNKNRLRAWIKNIFSFFAFLIILIEILILIFGTKTLKFLSSITDTGYRVDSYGVYVLNESDYKKLSDLEDKTLMYLVHDDEDKVKEALDKLEKKAKVNEEKGDSLENLITSLEKKETDAILLEKSYEDIIREEFEDIYEKITCIETIDIVNIVEVEKGDVDITKDPFFFYVSGIDTSGNVGSKARSDVNLVLGINPSTKQILMINTPRDYHVTLASKQSKDKLTHAGIYGIEESVSTLENLYDTKIDYYMRINFTSFIKIVSALDGIKVNVPKSFCEQNSHRSFAKGDLICLNKGVQTLNGEQALALARHRKTIGDRERGKNQMLIVEAIINKAMSPKIITKYTSILNALEGRVVTNMQTDEIGRFVKKAITGDESWNFESISANGRDARAKCYSTGRANLSVIEPDEQTIEAVKLAISNLKSGKNNLLEGTAELTSTTKKTVKAN